MWTIDGSSNMWLYHLQNKMLRHTTFLAFQDIMVKSIQRLFRMTQPASENLIFAD